MARKTKSVKQSARKSANGKLGAGASPGSANGTRSVPATKSEPSLVLTGERENDRFKIVLDGRTILLQLHLFQALCELVAQAVEDPRAYLAFSPTIIHRLRRACGGKGCPQENALVRTGCDPEYRLALALKCVTVDPSLAELPAPRFITAGLKSCLLGKLSEPIHCRRATSI